VQNVSNKIVSLNEIYIFRPILMICTMSRICKHL